LLYTNNPFYLISAWLVFYGLRVSFADGNAYQAGALLAGLAGYTLLLTISAVVLIRWFRVWDDARGLLLLVVLMLISISVCFDDALAKRLLGASSLVGGLAFSVLISETLLLGAGIRLRFWFRLPYYLLLGLFFLYPICLTPLIGTTNDQPLHFALLGFPLAVGVVLLTLLPAIRRGAEYVRESRTPWRWPLYPWTLFGLLVACACFRTYFLCASFSMFNIYGFCFLSPILFAVALLIHESGVVAGNRGLQRFALVIPLLLVVVNLAGTGMAGSTSNYFLHALAARLGAMPPFITLVAALAFYGVAAVRRLPFALGALSGAVALFSVVGPPTSNLESLQQPWGLPLVLVSLLAAAISAKQRCLSTATFAAACGLLGLTFDLRAVGLSAYLQLRELVIGLEYLVVGGGAFLIAMLISLSKGGVFRRLAATWRKRVREA
jgi:hypothetical protein